MILMTVIHLWPAVYPQVSLVDNFLSDLLLVELRYWNLLDPLDELWIDDRFCNLFL